MEIILEIVFSFVAEILLAVFGEALLELGFHSLAENLGSRMWRRVAVGLLYSAAGFLMGGISLKFLSLYDFGGGNLSLLYFVISPIVAGLALCLTSWIIDRGIQDRGFFQPSKFFYGAIFALTFAAARTYFG